ncbi:hypothetical protein P8452_23558 [Trifolium repens]|nr:hypothetical protein P8452_23558 [Trifolium repens]
MKASGDGNLLFNPFTRNSGQQLTVYTPLTLTGITAHVVAACVFLPYDLDPKPLNTNWDLSESGLELWTVAELLCRFKAVLPGKQGIRSKDLMGA